METYRHLGPFGDLVGAAADLNGAADPYRPPLGSEAVRRLLKFDRDTDPIDARIEARWSRDGVDGEEVSWSPGYGPRTHGWLLRPHGVAGPLPGVLALHGHDGYKYWGKEKIADGPYGPMAATAVLRAQMYEDRAFANELARQGFVVLVADVFLWGSRRFPEAVMTASVRPLPGDSTPAADESGDAAIDRYNRVAARHEHVVAKYCAVLGTSLAGVVSHEDRVAVSYLASRPEVAAGALGCVGLSGGGCRAALLQATCERIGATVIVGMMSTHRALLDRHVADHSWMFFPPELAAVGDWPDLAAARAPSPLMVQYLLGDALFPVDGMREAHRRLTDIYARAGAAESYVGEFFPGPHRFDVTMQESAFARLRDWLR